MLVAGYYPGREDFLRFDIKVSSVVDIDEGWERNVKDYLEYHRGQIDIKPIGEDSWNNLPLQEKGCYIFATQVETDHDYAGAVLKMGEIIQNRLTTHKNRMMNPRNTVTSLLTTRRLSLALIRAIKKVTVVITTK